MDTPLTPTYQTRAARLRAAARHGAIGLAALFTILTLPAAAGPQLADPAQVELTRIGQLGGAARAIAVVGTRAYVGIGPRLAVVDVSDPAAPRMMGQTEALQGPVQDVAVVGTDVFAACGHGDVYQIDASEPAAPQVLTLRPSCGASNQDAIALAVSGRWLYVVGANPAKGIGLWLDDIQRSPPVTMGFAPLPAMPTDVAVADGLAYVTHRGDPSVAGDGGLFVFDFADPAAPRVVSTYTLPNDPLAVAIDGSHLVLATEDSGLAVFDLANPLAPKQVGQARYSGDSVGVTLADGFAYVTVQRYDDVGNDELRIVDVRNPADPKTAGILHTAGTPAAVVVAGSHAYVANGGDGLRVVDVANPAAPRAVGQLDVSDYAENVVVDGRFAYVPDRVSTFAGDRLAIVDVGNPTGPRDLGSVDLEELSAHLPVSVVALAAADGFAYVGTENLQHGGERSLQVIDARDPMRPVVAAVVPGARIDDMAAAGGYLFTVSPRFAVWDVRDPARPRELASLDTVVGNAIAIADGRAYVVENALTVINVQDPATPRVLGSERLEGQGQLLHPATGIDVSVAGNYAIVIAAPESGHNFYVFSVSPASDPRIIDVDHWSEIQRVYFVQGIAYLAAKQVFAGLDLRTTPRPTLMNDSRYWRLPGNVTAVHGDGQHAIALAEGQGLHVFDLTTIPLPPGPEIETTSVRAADLNIPRAGHSATLLADGRVLVAGGYNRQTTTNGIAVGDVKIYDPVADLSPAPALRRARWDHTATLLDDGRVLVAGGFGDAGRLGGAEVFDPAVGTWQSAGDIGFAIAGHTATRLADGRVLVVGKSGHDVLAQTVAAIYDPAEGIWHVADPMGPARNEHSATLLASGEVLVAGGFLDSRGLDGPARSAYIFNPQTGRWREAGLLTVGRARHAAARLPDGKVLVVGGSVYDPGTTPPMHEIFDPETESWRAVPELAGVHAGRTVVALPDGRVMVPGAPTMILDSVGEWHTVGSLKHSRVEPGVWALPTGQVLVVGGARTMNDVEMDPSAELFDPATGEWRLIPDFLPAVAPRAERGWSLTPLADGRLLVAGGYGVQALDSSATAEIYDPATDTWRQTGALNSPHHGYYDNQLTSVRLADGRVLLIDSGGQPELFDPLTETWQITGTPGHFGSTATLLADGRVLVAGGHTTQGSQVAEPCVLFDPVTNTWSATGAILQPRTLHSAALLADGRVLVAGGYAVGERPPSGPFLSSAELFNPASGTWRPAGNLAAARGRHAAIRLANGSVMLIGGHLYPLDGIYPLDKPLEEVELYDPATDRWQPAAGPQTRRFPGTWSTTLLPDGTIWILGGEKNGNEDVLATGLRFYPPAGPWLPAGRMDTGRQRHTATVLADGRVLVAGGAADPRANFGTSLQSAEIFDPRGWPGLKRVFLPVAQRHHGSVQ